MRSQLNDSSRCLTIYIIQIIVIFCISYDEQRLKLIILNSIASRSFEVLASSIEAILSQCHLLSFDKVNAGKVTLLVKVKI